MNILRKEPGIVKSLREEEKIGLLKANGSLNYEPNEIEKENEVIESTKFKENHESIDEIKLTYYKEIIENSPDSIIIIDKKGYITYCNKATEKISGYNRENLIGQNYKEFGFFKNQDLPRMIKIFTSLILGKEIKPFEVTYIDKNGNQKTSEINLTLLKSNRKTIGVLAIARDNTNRKKTTEEIKLMDNAIKSSINGILIANSLGNITYVNPAFLKMWSYHQETEVIGKPIVKFWQMKGEYMKVIDAMINEGGWVGELIAEKKDGSTFPVQLSANPLYDENSQLKYMLASFVDITEQKKAEDNLRESQKRIKEQNINLKKLDELKSNFLNITSHELRTPMSSIKGYVQMMLKEILGKITDEQKDALNVILRNTNRLDNLIKDILDVSRLESGTLKFIIEKTDINKLINETIETMQSDANRKEILIVSEIKNDLPELKIDNERITQVLINLISNAIKYSNEKTKIIVKASSDEKNITFEVKDFGREIPKDKQVKIFNTFYQVDSGMDRKFGGAGLGLAISRGIVIAHGGKIWVESEINNGTTFKFTIPIKSIENIEERFRDINVFGLGGADQEKSCKLEL